MRIPGAPLLALTFVGLVVGAIVAAVAIARGRTRVAQYAALVAGAWLAAYATALVVTSLASHERLLSVGEAKRFCGFYLDCHMGMAVDRVDTTSVIGAPGDQLRAGGTFYVITLRVSSDARRVPLRLNDPRITIVDDEGFHYDRSQDAERKLAGAQLVNLEQPVNAGESFTRVVVIDVPRGVRDPRLHVTMGGPLERAVELVIIGDEDAVLHAPTLHALTPGSGVSSASAP
jgi:hypothetical protein